MRARRLLAACSFVWIAALGGCGDESSPLTAEPGAIVRFEPAGQGPTDFGEIPWPSDLYLDASGEVAAVPGLERLASFPAVIERGLIGLDGFGRSTGAIFFVDAAIDASTLPRTWDEAGRHRGVMIVDVDPASSKRGERYPVFAKYLPRLGCISVIPVPGIVLPPGVRHAAVLTERVRTETGGTLAADDELSRIAGSTPSQRSQPVEQLYGDALDELVDSGAVRRRSEVAGLAVFTTSRRVRELPALRQRLQLQPEPVLFLESAQAAPYTAVIFGSETSPSLDDWLGAHPVRDEQGREWPGGDNPGGIAHDHIGVVASGAFVAPSFLNRSTGHFEKDSAGEIVLANPSAKIPVTLMLPRQAAPETGFPVVVHGHGLSNHRGSMFGIANELARAGFAMIAIDDVQHGSRQGIRDLNNNYGGSYRGPDGIPDGVGLPIAFFSGFGDFVAIRDNFRQTVLDQVSLVRLIRARSLDLSALAPAAGGSTPRLDPERIYWSGGSLGGIMGAMTIAVEPEIDAAALQVPGASFVQLITTNSAEVAPLVGTISRTLLGLQGDEAIDEFHPVANLLAAATEMGDPIAYAPHVLRDPLLEVRTPPDILISYAVGDEVLPNIATIALIRALGVEIAQPALVEVPGVDTRPSPVIANLESGRTGAAVQYMPANHGLGYARYDTRKFLPDFPSEGEDRFPTLPTPFSFEQPVREHADQLVTFLESLAGGPGRIEVTSEPRQDFDGDGLLDDEERGQGSDPLDPGSR